MMAQRFAIHAPDARRCYRSAGSVGIRANFASKVTDGKNDVELRHGPYIDDGTHQLEQG
jgi:hypothetical protein